MGSHPSKRKSDKTDHDQNENDGDGLNLFSDNENTDHEDDTTKTTTTDTNRTKKTASGAEEERQHDPAEDTQEGGKEQRKRPKSSRLIAMIQDSVRRYEQERRSIRQLQQLRRAQIYSGHSRNLALFHSLLQAYGTRNGAPTWDQILQGELGVG